MAYRPWFAESGIGQREMAANREYRKAVLLFSRIREEIGSELEFTLEELLDAVNERVGGGMGKLVRFGPSHVRHLLRHGFLERLPSGRLRIDTARIHEE